MKYSIGMIQKVFEETTVIVEAATEDEAIALAHAMVNKGDVEWRFLECSDEEADVVSVEEDES